MADKLQPYQQKVVAEKKELDLKLKALISFSNHPTFSQLPEAEKERLRLQTAIMSSYSEEGLKHLVHECE